MQPARLNACSAFEKPHIWWIGSGIAGSFPFYAASSLNVPSETVLSRLISSYTPTIKALAYPRVSLSAQKSFTTNYLSVLVVTMPSTPGQGELKGVSREKNAIGEAFKVVCSFKELRLPSAERVLAEIPRANITHFACHRLSDLSNPSSSHLLLQKNTPSGHVVDRLTVSQISAVTANGQAWIAFLSACSTAKVKGSKFADGSLHLASSFQVAGFTHVIASMWSTGDDVCVRVADLFHGELTRNGMRDVRN